MLKDRRHTVHTHLADAASQLWSTAGLLHLLNVLEHVRAVEGDQAQDEGLQPAHAVKKKA